MTFTIYPSHGGWTYAVWRNGKPLVFGWKSTLKEAEEQLQQFGS